MSVAALDVGKTNCKVVLFDEDGATLSEKVALPPFLEPRKTSEKALVAVIQEAWVGGVSTRRVDDLVQAMGRKLQRFRRRSRWKAAGGWPGSAKAR